MTEAEKKEIIEVLQSVKNPPQWDVQRMVAFGILAFLAQFVFNQFAGDGQKISTMLVAQESLRIEVNGLGRDVEAIRRANEKNLEAVKESTEKRYRSDDAEKDIGILQRQIDVLTKEVYDRGKGMEQTKERVRQLELELVTLKRQIESAVNSTGQAS